MFKENQKENKDGVQVMNGACIMLMMNSLAPDGFCESPCCAEVVGIVTVPALVSIKTCAATVIFECDA